MIPQTPRRHHAVPALVFLVIVACLGQPQAGDDTGLPPGTALCLSVRRVPWGFYPIAPNGALAFPDRVAFEVLSGACSPCTARVMPGAGRIGFAAGVVADAEARQSLEDAVACVAGQRGRLGPGLVPTDFPHAWDVTIQEETSGATLEGPSSGVAYAAAILSALSGRPIASGCAFTGTIDTSGRIGPVGGVLDKLRAAGEAGIRSAIVPGEPDAVALRLAPELRAVAGYSGLRVVFVGTLAEAAFHAFGPEVVPLEAGVAYDREFARASESLANGDTATARAAFAEMDRLRPGDTTAVTWSVILTISAALDALERGSPASASRIVAETEAPAGLPAGWAAALTGLVHLLRAIDAALRSDLGAASAEAAQALQSCPADPDTRQWAMLIERRRDVDERHAPSLTEGLSLPEDGTIGQWAARCVARAVGDRDAAREGRRVVPLALRIDEALAAAADGVDDALVTVLTACDLIEAQTGLRLSPQAVAVGDSPAREPDGRELIIGPCPDQAAEWKDVLIAEPGGATIRVRVPEGYDRPVWYVMRALLISLGAREEPRRKCVMSGSPDGEPCLTLCARTRAEIAER